MKKRLDILLCDMNFTATRSRALQLIKGGYVFVEGIKCKKGGTLVDEGRKIEIEYSPFVYVSRAGIKLKAAIDNFKIDLKDKICLDIGSSTGGFSDCMLKEKAKVVYAVDVGSNQMHKNLRKDDRVVLFENTDIRDFKSDVKFDFVSVDVSFISLKHILPCIKKFMKEGAKAVVLVKPQFEAGPNIVKKGIVKDKRLIKNIVEDIKQFGFNIGLAPYDTIKSPILGKSGNEEHLVLFKYL